MDSELKHNFLSGEVQKNELFVTYADYVANRNNTQYNEETIRTIDNEILAYENTNFIADSGFETKQQIFAIGDSHCLFFLKSIKIKNHWLYGMPITIYTLLREGLDIFNIGTNLENHQGIFGKGHSKYNIKEKDFVIFFFGWNDMQKNINLHAADRWREEIDDLINKYVRTISMSKGHIIPIIANIYPNPRVGADLQTMRGSEEERRNYFLYANGVLRNLCAKNGILFLNLYDLVTDENDCIREEFTSDNIHLDWTNLNLIAFVEDRIVKFCQSYL
jgi:hypothetical protein